MTIELEMVDKVIERTGASYEDAVEALKQTDGDVVEAIVYLEKQGKKQTFSDDNVIIKRLKELIKKGKVSKIIVKKDNKAIINVPVVAGAVSAVFFAGATFAAVIAAVATGCELFIITDTGKELNLKEMTGDAFDDLKSKVDDMKHKFEDEEIFEQDFTDEDEEKDE
jgi:NACalpha-BTF3-like transcription factor